MASIVVTGIFDASNPGFVPASGGGTTNFLRADGTWVAAGGGGSLSDGDKGDITVTGSGATWTIDNGVVTTAKMGGDVTTAGKALLDDADAAAQRTTLGLGTAATQASTAFAASTRVINTTAPLTGGGDLSADRTLAVNTFGAAQAGVVPPSGGGTTNFLRADGSWAAPTAAVAATEVQLNFGTDPVDSKQFTVTDAAVTPTSKIIIVQSAVAGAGGATDDSELDPIAVSAFPSSGSFTVNAHALKGRVVGKYMFNYQVAT